MNKANPTHMSEPQDMLPLTSAVLHILLALADGPKHGYAMMQEVTAIAEGRIKMGPGTLYGSIKRMLASGLIQETGERPISERDDARSDSRRRYYKLTAFGCRVVAAEMRRLENLVRVAQDKRLAAPGQGA